MVQLIFNGDLIHYNNCNPRLYGPFNHSLWQKDLSSHSLTVISLQTLPHLSQFSVLSIWLIYLAGPKIMKRV
ncbi:hypothetical protein YC2023_064011 [Brassica napus]